MIDIRDFAAALYGKPVAIFGLGASNRAVAEALGKANVPVALGDDDPAKADIELLREDLGNYAYLVVAPGVRPSHPVVQKACAAGIEIICDVEILHRCRHGRRTVGITGTNGKSTTTALVGHILHANHIACAVGGNIGAPVLALQMPPMEGIFVLELSSYQLEYCPTFAPEIAVLLNLTPDHLDWHGDLASYRSAKEKIFRGPGRAIIFAGNETHIKNSSREIEIITALPDVNNPALRGAHNRQNAAAAIGICRALGLKDDDIFRAVETFPGLPHRQFSVRTIKGIDYINDSKATNADAAKPALETFPNIYWIAGGQAKAGGLAGLERSLKNIRHVFLIGAATEEFAAWLQSRDVPYTRCITLDEALPLAHAQAQAQALAQDGGLPATVLLSPAAASYDQFKNFEQRGEVFSNLVLALKEQNQ